MNTKQAIITKNGKLHGGFVVNHGDMVDYRGPREYYEKAYTKEQIDYLFKNNLLRKYKPCGASWEYPYMGEYWEFTDKGIKLRQWYTHTLKEYLYYNVFHLYNIRIYWEKICIKMGHKYEWQDYEGIDLDEI